MTGPVNIANAPDTALIQMLTSWADKESLTLSAGNQGRVERNRKPKAT